MTTLHRKTSFFLACTFLSLALFMEQQWVWAALALCIGAAVWLLIDRIKWQTGWVAFFIFVAVAATGTYLGFPLWLMLPVVLFALVFWDLDAFLYRLSWFEPNERIQQMEKAHYIRLVMALVAGTVISLPGLFLRLDLSLGWAILLGLVIFLGIRLGIRAMGERVSDESRP
jgi:hypothetical protein